MASSKVAHAAKTDSLSASDELARCAKTIELQAQAVRSLCTIAGILSEPGSFTVLVTRMLEEVKTFLDLNSADLRMPDGREAGLRVVASVGSAQQPPGTFRSYGDSRTGRAFQSGEPIVAHDYEVNHRGGPERGRRYRSGYEAQSVAWIPVRARGRTMGVLAVDTAKRKHFTVDRVQLLTTIADATGVFLEAAKLRETEHLHVQELEVLNRAATIFAGGGTFREKANRVLKAIVEQMGDWATLRVIDESREHLVLVTTTRPGTVDVVGVGEGLSGNAFSSRKPAVVDDYSDDPKPRQAAVDSGLRSRVAVPVVVNGLGRAVLIVSSRSPNYFTPERVALLETIATGIGPSLERAKLEADARRRERERSKTVSQLQVAQQRLIQSAKLAAVGALVSGVAREINDPLAGILSHTRSLLRSNSREAPAETLELIHAEAQRVDGIVQNLLSLAQWEEPQKRPMSVNGALTRVIELRSYDLHASHIDVLVDLDPALPLVMGDLHQIEQVFLNIIANAQHAMSSANAGGRLEIMSRRLHDAVQVTFTDDGPGIPAKSLQKVFDPFFTTDGEGRGAGLGLTICHSIVQAHQGALWVRSPRRNGTVVGVELPLPHDESWSAPIEPLSDRELSVLGLMAQGLSNGEIAASFSVSLHTIKTHVGAVLRKLEAPNRTSAIRIAREADLID